MHSGDDFILNFPGMTFLLDEQFQFKLANKDLIKRLGYAANENLIGLNSSKVIQANLSNFSENGIIDLKELKTYAITKENGKIPVELYISTIKVENGFNYICFIIDKSSELSVEFNLLHSDLTFKKLVGSIEDAVLIVKNDDTILYANDGFLKMFLYSLEEVLNKKAYNLMLPKEEISEEFITSMVETRKKGISNYFEIELYNSTGRKFWVETSGVPIRNREGEVVGAIGVIKDISERKIAREDLEDSLKEKEVLLKEMHHRVKNNLQIITSLLSLQSHHTTDEEVEKLLKDSQNRIRSMSIIHEKLYRSDSLSDIAFKDYVSEIVEHLKYSYELTGLEVEYNIDDVSFDLEKAVPCGLILNELVANAMKYAFKDKKGKISILLKKQDNGILLTISDNGIGLPEGFDLEEEQESLGMQLVVSLIEQIDGTIKLDNTNGAKFIMNLPQ